MLPTEQYSGDAVPQVPWTPDVWKKGPDGLVQSAQSQLFVDQRDIVSGVLDAGDRAMSGNDTAPQNESDQLISANPGPTSGVKGTWDQCMSDMRQTEPLAAWSSGQKDGEANPPA